MSDVNTLLSIDLLSLENDAYFCLIVIREQSLMSLHCYFWLIVLGE